MKKLLEQMVVDLRQAGLEAVKSDQELRRDALASGTSVYYAQAFLEWLKVCPEARDWLNDHGMPFEGDVGASYPALQDAPQKGLGAGEFFAYAFGGQLMLVRLEENLGSYLKVVEARPPRERAGCPRRTCIGREQVPDHLRFQLDQALGKKPEQTVQWASEGSEGWEIDNPEDPCHEI